MIKTELILKPQLPHPVSERKDTDSREGTEHSTKKRGR